MEYRLLGRSGLKVSALSIGTVTFGNDGTWGDTELDEARRQIDLSLDRGVNLIDTSNAYNAGKSESIIGQVLSENGRRDRMLISTKVRFPAGTGPNDQGLSRWHIIRQAEGSLKRLKTDVIDLYHVHEWDGQTPLEETIEALDTLIKQGKVRYLASSNYSAWHMMKALGIADAAHWQRFVGQQIHYTLQARDAEFELIPLGLDQGVGTLVWSPLAGGWLTGKYTRDKKPEIGRHVADFPEPPIYDFDKLWDIVDVIVEIGKAHNVSGAQVALAWLLQRPTVSTVILGGRNVAQFDDSLKAADLKLTADEIRRLDEISQPNLIYPYWHQSFTAAERLGSADLSLLKPYIGKPLGFPARR